MFMFVVVTRLDCECSEVLKMGPRSPTV